MRKRSLPILARACLAASTAVLFLSCSGDSAGPTTPPPPPPFQPQTVVVQLGTAGGATTLISTQAGGWTRNGQPFTSGSTVTGENAASYRLTLSNGRWTAEFIAPDPEPLVLGASGDAVLLQAREDGSYEVDGEPLASGRVVEADNGNQYRLVRGSDGTWMAEYVPPAPQLVHLGTSGESRQVSRLEDGGYIVNGVPLAPGSLITTGNGNRYTLTLGADGMWAAVFVEADPQRLQLGTSGDAPLLIYRQENGTFRLNNEPLLGGRVIEASNGNRYRLTLGPDRSWQASYIPDPVTVRLGSTGGVVSLTPNEDGTWLRGSASFSSGDRVTGSNGFEYVLTLGSDGWFAEPVPMTVEVEVVGSDAQAFQLARLVDGTYLYDGEPVNSGDTVTVGGSTYRLQFANNRWTAQFLRGVIFVELGGPNDLIELTRNADGTYEYDGRRVRSGSIQRSPNTGIRYRLRLAGGVWSASVYVPPTIDPGGGDPGVGTPPVGAENIFDALPDELIATDGTFSASDTSTDPNYRIQSGVSGRNADGDEVDYGRYRGSGSFEDDTFVESVLRAIASILEPIERDNLVEGTDSQRFVAGVLIDANWPDVVRELNAIFGGDPISFTKPLRGGETDVDEAVDELEDLREDLTDVAKFRSRFMTRIDAANTANSDATADTIFNARKRVLALGASANTRFGVISTLTGTPTAVGVASGTLTTGREPFAFSPLSNTPTAALPSRGIARYSGRTWAVADDLALYSGSIELLASIGIERVTATVSDLRHSDTNASWAHDNKEVQRIELPEINQADFDDTNASFDASSVTAEVVYVQSGGFFPESVTGSDLVGQFVGTETGQNAGRAVIGTWNVGADLEGSFGAERIRTNPATLPSLTSSNRYRVVSRTILDNTTIDNSDSTSPMLTLSGVSEYTDTFALSSLGSVTNRAQSDDSNFRATIRVGTTSFARFGAWKVVNSTNDPAVTTNGLFAYSPLADTNFGTDNNYYPRRVSAEYAGRTVAIDGTHKLYNGSYLLTVEWDPNNSASEVAAVISGLSGFTIGGVGVSQLGFSQTFSGSTFGPATTSLRVRYTTGSDVSLTDGTYEHQGQFVGSNGPDGPYGVFGRWSIDQGDDDIKGAFGADLVRAP